MTEFRRKNNCLTDNDTIVFQLGAIDYRNTRPGRSEYTPAWVADVHGTHFTRLDAVPVIRMFGCTDDGRSVLVRVHGFEPYFYSTMLALDRVQLDHDVSLYKPPGGDRNKSQQQQRLPPPPRRQQQVYKRRRNDDDDDDDSDSEPEEEEDDKDDNADEQYQSSDAGWAWIVRIEEVASLKPLRCFHEPGATYRFLKITTRLPAHVSIARQYFETVLHAKTYEAKVQFPIRFMINKGITGCDWIKVANNSTSVCASSSSFMHIHYFNMMGPQTPRCNIEVDTWWTNITSLGVEGAWSKHAPLRVLSFDIECAAPKGMFPNAASDPVITICSRVTHPEDSNSRIRTNDYALAIQLHTCDPVPTKGVRTLSVMTETDLLLAWSDFVVKTDPDVITGYNICNFDFSYLVQRAEKLGITNHFADITRVRGDLMRFEKGGGTKSSRAFGTRERDKIEIAGRDVLDMLPVVQQEMNRLSSYTLNAVAAVVTGGQKIDLNHNAITPLFEGSSADRCKIATYCDHDCELPLDIMDKKMFLGGTVEMARATNVPFAFVYGRGQQIRVQTQLGCVAFQLCIIIETSVPLTDSGGYEGATVIKPCRGYMNYPVPTLDFASLYPSIMQAFNLCYITRLTPDQAASMPPGMYYRTPAGHYFVKAPATFAEKDAIACGLVKSTHYSIDPAGRAYLLPGITIPRLPTVEKLGLKEGVDVQVCANDTATVVVDPRPRFGLLPTILKSLLAARSRAKKLLAKEPIPERRKIYDNRQLKLKISANSVYGATGASTSAVLFQPEIASSVTAYGRDYIKLTQETVESTYSLANGHIADAHVKYGDSVTGDTALIIRRHGHIAVVRIDDLGFGAWAARGDGKEICLAPEGAEVWSDTGFTPIRTVIRHMANTTIYRVVTHTGIVDCTPDHSLLRDDSTMVRPSDVAVGNSLLHGSDTGLLPLFNNCISNDGTTITDVNEAYAMGMFFAEGSCGRYNCPSGLKYSWAINGADHVLLERTAAKLPFPSIILDTLTSSGVYKLVPIGDYKTPAIRYRRLFYNFDKEKRVPEEILLASQVVVQAFWDGTYDGDGDVATRKYQTVCRIDQKGKQSTTGLWLLARRLGYLVSINCRPDKPNIFRLNMTCQSKQRRPPNAVKKIYTLSPPQQPFFVYDLETESHHFHVGPGNLVVHNTDSVMVDFGIRAPVSDAILPIAVDHILSCGVLRNADMLRQCAAAYVPEKRVTPSDLVADPDDIYAESVVHAKAFGKYLQTNMVQSSSSPIDWLHVATTAVGFCVYPQIGVAVVNAVVTHIIDRGLLEDVSLIKKIAKEYVATTFPEETWRRRTADDGTSSKADIAAESLEHTHAFGQHLCNVLGDRRPVYQLLVTKALDRWEVDRAAFYGKPACDLVTKRIGKWPMSLAFEKVFLPYLLRTKKRYAGYKYMENPGTGIMEDKGISVSGFENIRRDNSLLTRITMDRALKDLIIDRDIVAAIKHVRDTIANIRIGGYTIDKYVITRAISKQRKAYVKPQIHERLVARIAQRQAAGGYEGTSEEYHVGDRVPYVRIALDRKAKGYEHGEDPLLVARKNLPLDTEFYVNKAIIRPLGRIFMHLVGNQTNRVGDIFEPSMPIECVLKHKEPAAKQRIAMPQVRIVARTDTGSAMGRFLVHVGSNCLACNAPIQGVARLCPDRCAKDHTIVHRVRADIESTLVKLRGEERQIDDTCAKCSGTAQQCTNAECPTLYMHIKNAADIEDCVKKKNAIG